MATQEQVAEFLCISQQTLSKLVRKGILPRAERGDYDQIACFRAYMGHLKARIRTNLIKSFTKTQKEWALSCGFFSDEEIEDGVHL